MHGCICKAKDICTFGTLLKSAHGRKPPNSIYLRDSTHKYALSSPVNGVVFLSNINLVPGSVHRFAHHFHLQQPKSFTFYFLFSLAVCLDAEHSFKHYITDIHFLFISITYVRSKHRVHNIVHNVCPPCIDVEVVENFIIVFFDFVGSGPPRSMILRVFDGLSA